MRKKNPFHLPLRRAFRRKKKREIVESIAFFSRFFKEKTEGKKRKEKGTSFFCFSILLRPLFASK